MVQQANCLASHAFGDGAIWAQGSFYHGEFSKLALPPGFGIRTEAQIGV